MANGSPMTPPRPVRAELEFHGDAGDDARQEVDAEDAGPEAGGIVVGGVPGSQRERLEGHDEQGQAHGQLRKQVVVGDGEGKMNSVNEERVVHDVLRRAGRHNSTS
jgi:hypothetical protein